MGKVQQACFDTCGKEEKLVCIPSIPSMYALVECRAGKIVTIFTPYLLCILFQIFEEWCGSEANMIIMPGYCVAGTVGHKILNGTRTLDRPGKAGKLEVKMSVQYMSFSAHADAKGIMQVWPVTKFSFLHGRNRTTKNGHPMI